MTVPVGAGSGAGAVGEAGGLASGAGGDDLGITVGVVAWQAVNKNSASSKSLFIVFTTFSSF
jgi:hypothetical protein